MLNNHICQFKIVEPHSVQFSIMKKTRKSMKFSLLRSLISPINWLIISALWQSKLQKLILQRIFFYMLKQTRLNIWLNILNCTVDTVNKMDDQLSQKAVIRLGQTVRISVALIYSYSQKKFLGQGHFHGFRLYISRSLLSFRWDGSVVISCAIPICWWRPRRGSWKLLFCCYFQASYVFFNLL